MRKQIYTTFLFLLLSAVAYAQNPVFEGTPIPDQFAELEPHFYSYEIYRIETNPLHDFVHSKDDGVTFSLQLGDAHNWNIGIVPRDIRAPNYILRVQTENGIEELPPGENLTFQGQLNEGDGGDVALTIDQDFIYGFVEQGEQSYFIEPLWYFVPDQPTNLFVVYSNNDVRPSEGKCGVNEMEQHKPQVPALNTAADRSGGCFTIELSIAADNSMFNKFGSTAAVQAHTLGVMNNVQTNYDNEFPDVIQFAIVEQFIARPRRSGSMDGLNRRESPCSLILPIGAQQALHKYMIWGSCGQTGTLMDLTGRHCIYTRCLHHLPDTIVIQ